MHTSRRARGSRTHHAPALRQIDRLAWLLDNSIRIPIINYRIGLDPLLGLIPGFGDLAGLLLSSVIVLQAIRLGASKSVLIQMILNIWIEAALGVIPGVGDLFDAVFKANIRNVQLLEALLGEQPEGSTPQPIVGRGVIIGVIAALVLILVIIGWAAWMVVRWLGWLFS